MNKPATDELNKLKEKFDYHVLMYNSPGYNSANDFKTKEYLKWIYEKLLLNFNTVVSAPKLSVYQSRLSTWEKRGIKPQIKFIQEIFQDVEDSCKQSPANKTKIKPLIEKINWKTGEDILITHLEKLRDKKFIDYDNINSVMSGEEIAVFIKHNTGKLKSSQNNATALFRFWNKNKLITDYIFNTTNQDTGEAEEKESHNYICDAFYREKKENPFNYGSLKNNAKDPQRKHNIDNIIIHLESILI